jgi:hypothetical protein
MKRRKFLRNTVGIGFFALPGMRNLDRYVKQRQNVKESDAPENECFTSMKSIISRGDIHRNLPPTKLKPWIVLYQGNGRFGSCFGPWGLHCRDNQSSYSFHGSTRFTHLQHYIRGKFNADYLLPLGSIRWQTEPEKVTGYDQYQSFYDGTVTTKFSTADYSIKIISWFDAAQKDIAGFLIEVAGKSPAIIISTPRSIPLIYDQQIVPVITEQLEGQHYQASIKISDTFSTLNVVGDTQMIQTNDGLELRLKQGLNSILIAVNDELTVSANRSLQQTKKWWHDTWQKTGWLDLPDQSAQEIWVRSLAYTLCSHNDDGLGCSPPTGLAGNAWPFPFPFDSSCRHSLLLMTGHLETARKWVEFWHSRFEGLKDYTYRLFKSAGIFLPHVFPYGQAFGYHVPEPPNKYYYPIYNSSLMVRIADHTAIMVNDDEWTNRYAVPLIGEAAKFYLSHLKKKEDGYWHLLVIPSISLDESGDINKPDYVSGLISAQYSLQVAIKYGLDKDKRMQTILSEGLAYPALLAENGMYHNHVDPAIKDFGKQKHPDQLFALVHTPLGPTPDAPQRRAHELRYDTTAGAKEPRFLGHTLGEFILASARMHDAQAWQKDWEMMMPAKYMDPERIQFYESTGNNLAFYITTHGLFAQSLLETVVSTWWGELDICSCVTWKGTVRFGNIKTLCGVTVSGELQNGTGNASLNAWKDSQFKYRGSNIILKKGEKMNIRLKQNEGGLKRGKNS